MANEEKDALLATLNGQREHLLTVLDGLCDEDLRRPVLPSAWTALGLVRHLALEVEQFWFRRGRRGRADHADVRGRGLAGSGGPRPPPTPATWTRPAN